MMAAVVCAGAATRPHALAPEVAAFIDEMVDSHRFERKQLTHWFSQVRRQPGVLKAMARPTTALPWYEFRASHVSAARVRKGVEYWRANAQTLARACAEYGVPEEIIVATLGIETFYGRFNGKSRVFDALVTLAFDTQPRAGMFRGELAEFLLLSRELRLSPVKSRGSYAGALGVPQFLPSSYRRYAIDFDRDNRRDLWSHADAIGSVANYYRQFGWRMGDPTAIPLESGINAPGDAFALLLERGFVPHTTVAAIREAGGLPARVVADDAQAGLFAVQAETGTQYWLSFGNFYVITRYNRSINYALAVHELAQELRSARDARHAE